MSGLKADYLVAGAGQAGMSFVDELLNDTASSFIIADPRPAPGGHWVDSYPFVRLHQPAKFYGVGSRELSKDGFETSGLNAGMLPLASHDEIIDYFDAVMQERFLASDRVRYFPGHRVDLDDRCLVNMETGERLAVEVGKKLVDARYQENIIPKTHVRKFAVAEGAQCVPPNDLPDYVNSGRPIAVLGAGKTGIDSVLYLVEQGMDPALVHWVLPRDPWLWNRERTQPHVDFFKPVFEGFVGAMNALATANDMHDYARKMRDSGNWFQLDPDVEPSFYHAATVSLAEVEALRALPNKLRGSRVKKVSPGLLQMQDGSQVQLPPNTVFVDCTACALAPANPVSVFDGDRITLQMVRFPQMGYSAALAAVAERELDNDKARNKALQPLPLDFTAGLEGYLEVLKVDTLNRINRGFVPAFKEWGNRTRHEGFIAMAKAQDRDDPQVAELFEQMKTAGMAAMANLPKLTKAVAAGRK